MTPTDDLTTIRDVGEWLASQPPRELTPRQLAALSLADSGLTPAGRQEFSDLWRSSEPPESAAVAAALPLIRQFEGCQLTAYPDPESGGLPLTIGWGSTTDLQGRPFQAGDTITQQEADDLLSRRVASDERLLAQRIPCWGRLSTNQRAALLSFSYNCGNGWYGAEGFATLTGALAAGRFDDVPAALMLYVNPGGPSEQGLKRRRTAEGALWSSGTPAPAPAPAPARANPLVGVPYYSQRDSQQVSQRDRTCFSSSCAMLLETLKPGTLKGPNGDDAYLKVVQRFGDTTDPTAQVKALATFGIKARRIITADFQLLERHIAGGVPVPCGWLHRGPVDRPQGGGHWLIAYGIDQTHLTVHDPWGEPDLVSGATISSNGQALRFSRQNFGRRWMVEQVAGGGYRYAPGNGWAIVVDSVA